MTMMRSVVVHHDPENEQWNATWRSASGEPVDVTGPAGTSDGTAAEIRFVLEDLMGAVDAAVCDNSSEYGVWSIHDVEYRLTGACSDGSIYTVVWDYKEMRKARKLADIIRDKPYETPVAMRDLYWFDIDWVLDVVSGRSEEIRFGDPALPMGGGTPTSRAREIALDAINWVAELRHHGRGTSTPYRKEP